MASIKKLDKHVAELIAAGEVVERPASAVKEMVENSIDAGAKMISVEILSGGIKLISVSDDGAGIKSEDVSLAFERNATSKIYSKEDLTHIGTLGFRGEALASIAAVSNTELKTKTRDENFGVRIKVDGGKVADVEEFACENGTKISVRNLFFNTPARLKFLKSDKAESAAVAACMDRLALSHPDISFKLTRDRKMTLFTPGNGDLKTTIYSVFGKEFADSLLPIDFNHGEVKVSGFASKPEFSRGSRSMQFFFVNKRFVQSNTARAAFEEAFKNELMLHKFPAGVIFISLPFDTVDINTHPAKIEVRFAKEKHVYEAVYLATRAALSAEKTAPMLDRKQNPAELLMKNEAIKEEAKSQESFYQSLDLRTNESSLPKSPEKSEEKPSLWRANINHSSQATPQKLGLRQSSEGYARSEATAPREFIPPQAPKKHEDLPADTRENLYSESVYIGEAFATYVIFQKGENLYLVDKHAAHERLIFEELKNRSAPILSQILLAPIAVDLPKEEYNLMLSSSLELAGKGIMIDDFGPGTVLVREFPADLAGEDIKHLIEEIAQALMIGKKDINPKAWDDILHSVACKAAIKGGRSSSKEELTMLISLLEENGEIAHCPHGRPVAICLGKKEIEKRFGRI